MLNDLLGRLSEGENIVLPDKLRDLDVRSVHGSQRHSAVEHELHVAGSAGLLGSQRDLLGNVRCGDQFLRHGHVVVAKHDDFEIRAHFNPWRSHRQELPLRQKIP